MNDFQTAINGKLSVPKELGKDILFSDSHGRSLPQSACDKKRDISVLGYIKPGTTSSVVVQNDPEKCSSLIKDDSVVGQISELVGLTV